MPKQSDPTASQVPPTSAMTAAIVIIGNEILSGRTQDKNVATIATKLGDQGIRLVEVRIIPDIEATIIETVDAMRSQASFVFTSGGIGPTHDDITTASIGKLFKAKVARHPTAVQLLTDYYAHDPSLLIDARLKMAEIPEGARLLENPVSAAPGFVLENVYVLPGVPRILEAMVDLLLEDLPGGEKLDSRSVSAEVREGDTAVGLAAIAAQYPMLDLGSYPYVRDNRFGTSLVARGNDQTALDEAETALIALVREFGAEPLSARPGEGES